MTLDQGIEGSSPSSPANLGAEHGTTGAGRHEAAPDAVSDAVNEGVNALAAALHEAEVCLNWEPGYAYLGEDGRVHDDHGPAEHSEAARVAAALTSAGWTVIQTTALEDIDWEAEYAAEDAIAADCNHDEELIIECVRCGSVVLEGTVEKGISLRAITKALAR